MIEPKRSPTLAEYRKMESEDSNAYWRLASGDHLNLLDEAIELLDEREREIKRLNRLLEVTEDLREKATDAACKSKDQVAALRRECEALAEALKRHPHTQQCLEYAVKTALNCGCYNCIADCADDHRNALAAYDAERGKQ